MRPFRFGVVFTGSYDGHTWRGLARSVEDLGYSTLLVADHHLNPMATGPLLTAAAAETTSVRLGSYVYNNDFRHPALLAKEVATIDVLSDGRFELGIGAGWAKVEYDAVGISFDEPSVRADRFEEAVPIIRRLLAGETVDHDGVHYHFKEFPGAPRAVQERMPMLIGGGGPRMLRFAAAHADIVGIVPPSLPGGGLDREGFTRAGFQSRFERLARALDDRSPQLPEPERSILVFAVGDERAEAALPGFSDEDRSTSPYALTGDDASIIDALQQRRDEWGISYVVCFDADLHRFAPIVAALRDR